MSPDQTQFPVLTDRSGGGLHFSLEEAENKPVGKLPTNSYSAGRGPTRRHG